MSTTSVTKARRALELIAEDMQADARAIDNKPFTGKVVGEAIGRLCGAIASLTGIIADFLPPEEIEREPVPYKDYLPEDEEYAPPIGGAQ